MWVAVRSGSERGKSVRLGDERVVFGRDDDCEVSLPDTKISRRHAEIEPQPDGIALLRDLGSSNGTYVNGERVEMAELRGGEQIQLGDTVLLSSLEEPSDDPFATAFGGTLVGSLRQHGQSAVHRLRVQRSLRRVTLIAVGAFAVTAVVGTLVAVDVLRSDDDASVAVQRVVRAAAPGTVLIEAHDGVERVGTGTGWVLDGDDRLVVTNAHVVNGGSEFRVGANNAVYPARVVGVAPCEDLAVLEVAGARGLKALRLGRQATVSLGETVVAVGFPENASQEASLTSTTGVVSLVRSTYREAALDIPRYPNVIQTDAAINPGNSGGPLLDLAGRVVGVNSAARTLAPDGRIIQGQNYAIGIDRVREIVGVLRRGRSLGWSGVGFDYPTLTELARERLPAGLRVAQAVPGTGAERSGLAAARGVITAVNGMPISNSLASYCDAVAGVRSGERVMFTVLEPGRSARPRDVAVRME